LEDPGPEQTKAWYDLVFALPERLMSHLTIAALAIHDALAEKETDWLNAEIERLNAEIERLNAEIDDEDTP